MREYYDIMSEAIALFSGDVEKANRLINIILTLTTHKEEFPNIEMKLPVDHCAYFHNGECWKDIPDSVLKCKGHCNFFSESLPCAMRTDSV